MKTNLFKALLFDWEYSRSWSMHYKNNGYRYKKIHYLFEIADCRTWGKDGYDLLFKGTTILHAASVKELKKVVEFIEHLKSYVLIKIKG
jgi:hypothetical protein